MLRHTDECFFFLPQSKMLSSPEHNGAHAAKPMSEPPHALAHADSAPSSHMHNQPHTPLHIPKRMLQLMLFVLTVYMLIRYWNTPPTSVCSDAHDQDCLQHKKTKEQVSSILHQSLKAIIVMLILIQLVYFFDINITPLVATFGVTVAAMGFAVSEPLHDYIMGISLALSNKLRVNTKVNVVLYGQTGKQGPIFVTNLAALTVDGIDDTGNTIHIRYSYIQAIEVVTENELPVKMAVDTPPGIEKSILGDF